MGITGVITTESGLYVNTTYTGAVDSVEFEAYQIILQMSNIEWDTDMSDGANAYIILPFGLFSLTVYAYDSDGNMIDKDEVPFLLLFCRSSGGEKLGRMRQVLLNRLT